MCLAPSVSLPAAPAPPPTMLDPVAKAARARQRTTQRQAGGYNSTLLTRDLTQPLTAPKTLLGG